MANALRHGRANRVRALFWIDNCALILTLTDNGTGSGQIKEGIGFSGIRELAAALGGRFEAGNSAKGSQITARIPYPAREATA